MPFHLTDLLFLILIRKRPSPFMESFAGGCQSLNCPRARMTLWRWTSCYYEQCNASWLARISSRSGHIWCSNESVSMVTGGKRQGTGRAREKVKLVFELTARPECEPIEHLCLPAAFHGGLIRTNLVWITFF